MSPDGQNIVTGAGNQLFASIIIISHIQSHQQCYKHRINANNLVTGDETLRFWNVFPGPKNKSGFRLGPSMLMPSGAEIR